MKNWSIYPENRKQIVGAVEYAISAHSPASLSKHNVNRAGWHLDFDYIPVFNTKIIIKTMLVFLNDVSDDIKKILPNTNCTVEFNVDPLNFRLRSVDVEIDR